MRRAILVLGAAALVLGLVACGDDDGGGGSAPTADDLDGQTFTSTVVEGYDLVPDTTVQLAFDAGTVGFSAGCNQMSAPYEVADGQLSLTADPAGTLMACPDDLQAQDHWLTGFLTDGADATLDGSALTLTGGDVTLELSS